METVKPPDGIYTGQGIEVGGKILAEIYVVDKRINVVKIIKHKETSGYLEEAFSCISQEIVETQNLNTEDVCSSPATE